LTGLTQVTTHPPTDTLFSLLSNADRAAGDSLDSLYRHNCWKRHRPLLYLEEEAEISNDLLRYTVGNHR